jgi:hypothetical protein
LFKFFGQKTLMAQEMIGQGQPAITFFDNNQQKKGGSR